MRELKCLREGLMKSRFEQLQNLLNEQKCFKMICGAGNEDKEYVRKLAFVYTLGGASILDVSANPEVIAFAHDGISKAIKKSFSLGIEIKTRPFIMASVGMPGDHHVRKSYIDPFTCIKCGLCAPVCPTDAIPKTFHKQLDIYKKLGGSFESEDQEKEIVIKDLCIGCGKCSNICPKPNIISYRHNAKTLEELLPKCLEAGAECFELHASVGDEEVTLKEWEIITKTNPHNYNSICLDRLNLGNLNLEQRIENVLKLSGEKLIVQADGYPMSGGENNMNTTLQAVACADVINKKFNMVLNKRRDNSLTSRSKISSSLKYRKIEDKKCVKIILSGGTNGLSRKLAQQCGVRINGVAIGTYARDIVEEFVGVEDFFENEEVIQKAYNAAHNLMLANTKQPKKKKILTIAVDFDGTLCNYSFPEIGEQTKDQKLLVNKLIEMKKQGHKLILYTCRGDNEAYPCLTQAIEWCSKQGLFFDAINKNIDSFVKKSGPSPKPVADIYLDDKAVNVDNWKELL